jgi:RNA polymerase sigma-70 factor (ECF subfamily)
MRQLVIVAVNGPETPVAAARPERKPTVRAERHAPVPETVAALFRDGDEAAFATLMEALGPRIKAYAAMMLGSPEAADDLAQDIFVAAWTRRSQLRDPRRVEGWLFTIARHMVIRHAKARNARPESAVEPEVLDAVAPADDAPSARDRHLATESARLLADALGSLDEKRRELLTLRYFSGLSLAEIGEVLDMPLGSVGTTMMRALESLKKHFERRGLQKEDLLP